ncbi:Formin-like protein [Hamiltosporidium tvaerminnensis]|uniref:Formin-like protein n=1 Tax=Hamiltosporidium tvaerminnensis TaxID=1176355 RepID=A0A4Q9LQ17_9MICR|nr:hypothetical protein LUQ84_000312 [Hamiltosporidium tvaerminnensis]TBU04988.1 formin-like protein [Hamiltosporidium tvaerminnensis]TBU10603.1 Formin-like protein [Hamiltosporidium tvaerminnensis]
MDQNFTKELIQKENTLVKEKLQIKNTILDRINALAKASSSFIDKPITISNKTGQSRIDFDNSIKYDFDMSFLTENILVIGQCWNNVTEKMSGRNNHKDIKAFLDKKYKSFYTVWRLNTTKDDIFRNCQYFELTDYNLSTIVRICKSIKGYLSFDPKNVVVLEHKGTKNVFALLVSCILRYCKIVSNTNEALNLYLQTTNQQFISNTLNRYVQYFDNFYKRRENYFKKQLHQIIITTLPKIDNARIDNPMIVIYQNGEFLKTFTKNDIIIDQFYIILTVEAFFVCGDLKIALFQSDKGKTIQILELYLNTYDYGHGLYRFLLDDLDFNTNKCLPRKKFEDDFSIDVVFFEDETKISFIYNLEDNFINNLNILNEHFGRNIDVEVLKKLNDDGYDRVLSKTCLYLGFGIEETKKIIDHFYNKGAIKSLDMKKEEIEIFVDRKIKEEDTHQKNTLNFYIQNSGLENLSNYTYLETIPDKIEFTNEFLQSKKTKSLPPKAKKKPLENFTVKKPFHWVTIPKSPNSIFNELENISINIDYTKFEEWFCEPANTEIFVKELEKDVSVLKDTRRIFLVSLSIKSLEKRKIDIYNLSNVIYKNSNQLEYEDLLNIKTILPTEKEKNIMSSYKGSFNDINEVEKIMFKIDDIDLKSVIDILIFERKFYEDNKTVENILLDTKIVYEKILNSNNLRIILKAVLELGNTANYKYYNRKKAFGFKITSLYILQIFKGKKSNQTLFSFLVNSLIKQKPEIFQITKELSLIHKIKNEDIFTTKDRINAFINDYNNCIRIFKCINVDEKDLLIHINQFLSYSYTFLKDITVKYKEIYVYSSIIKRKFGENEKESITDILNVLSSFLLKLEDEYLSFRM